VLILAEEWKESLQQDEGKTNKMCFNKFIVVEKKKENISILRYLVLLEII